MAIVGHILLLAAGYSLLLSSLLTLISRLAAALGPPDFSRPLHGNDLQEFVQLKVEAELKPFVAHRGQTSTL